MSRSTVLVIAALATGVLYIVGAAALGTPPGVEDSPGDVLTWFADHGDGARMYAWTAALGTLSFAVYAGIVRQLLPNPMGTIFLIGAAAFVVENVIQGWVWAALALHPDTLEPGAARTLLDLASFWGPLLTGATTTMIGAVTVLGFSKPPLIPRWLTILGVIAFVEQLAETVTVFGRSGFIAPGGDMNLVLGAGLTLIWLIGLTVWAAGALSRGDSVVAE
jgi:hypothetical protein